MRLKVQSGISRLFIAICSTFVLAACDGSFSFKEVFKSCEPPKSSARYGINPGPVITTPAAGTPFNGTMTVGGTCEAGINVRISGSGVLSEVSTPCNAGSFTASVDFSSGEGSKEVNVSQLSSGNDEIVDILCFTQDSIPPHVDILGTSGAQALNRQTVNIEGICESGLTVTVSGPNLDSTVQTQCRSGRFVATVTFTGPDGLKNVIATQVDPAGNNGNDNENYNIDTTPPVVRITGPAPLYLTQNQINLTGTCENGSPVVLLGTGLAGGVNTADCLNGTFSRTITLSAGDGLKNIEASQTDPAGNRGTDIRDFSKDGTAPLVRFTSPATNTISTGSLAVQGTCETGLQVQISGSGIQNQVNTSCSAGSFSANLVMTSPDGTKNVEAAQVDLAGNRGSDSRNFIRDATSPLVTIDSPAANSLVQAQVALSGACENGLQVQISGSGAAAPSTATCSAGRYNSNVSLSSGDGTKLIAVSQTDLAGNIGQASRSFVRDQTGPNIEIRNPIAGSYVTDRSTISGICETGLQVTLSGDLLAQVQTNCVGGNFSAQVDYSVAQGNKRVRATQTDGAGNSAYDEKTYIKDTVAPLVSIVNPAAGSVHVSSLTLTGACENGLPVQISGSGAQSVQTTCNSGGYSILVNLSSGDGVKAIEASQTDLAGNIGRANRDFVRDSSAPNIRITGPAANTLAQSGLTLVGTCETGLPITLSGAGLGSPFAGSCSAGSFSIPILFTSGDGVKNIAVAQVDSAGNSGSDNRNFIRDNTSPVITITGPAAGGTYQNSLTLVGNCETGLTVNLSGAGLGGPSSTLCSGGNFSVLINLSAGDGNKNIIASQIDAAGNSGSDNRSFIRDSVGPNIAITAPAAGTIAQNGLTLVGTCENGYAVNLSGAGLSSNMTLTCVAGQFSSPIIFSNGDGTKNIIASQTDTAGNTASDARSFIKDTTAPVITITAPAANSTAQSGLVLVGACETGLPINLAGSGISAPMTISCSAGSYSQAILFSNGDGSKTITASQTDAAGNIGTASRNFIRDNTGPSLAITSPAVNTVGINGLTLGGTCEAGLNVNLSGSGLASPASTSCTAGTFSVAILFSNGDGVKNIVVTQTDGAGNSSSDNRNFLRDSTVPLVRITSPAAGTIFSGPFVVDGDCETGLSVLIGGSGVSNSGNAVCNAGRFTYNIVPSANDGNKTVQASQTDLAGNTSSDSRTFILDSGAPVVRITGPAANSVAQSGVRLIGTCENGLAVMLGGSGLSSPSSTSCAGGNFQVDILFSNGDGAKLITASQTDGAGNIGSDSRSFIRDTTAPNIAITAPAADSVSTSGLTLVGTCESGLTVNLSGTGLGSPSSTSCSAGSFSVSILFSNGDGPKLITASQTDAAGNSASSSRSFIRDGTAPVITIASPAANSSSQGSILLTGSCESGLSVSIGGAGVANPQSVGCIASSYSANLNLTAGDGAKAVLVSQTDLAGNTGSANRSFIRDNTAPLVAITSPAANSFVSSNGTISGTCETGLSVVLSGDLSANVTTACSAGSFSSLVVFSNTDGVKNITATQTDLAGNIGSGSRSFIRDSLAPSIQITSPAANTVAQSGLNLIGTCESGLVVNLSGAGLASPSSTACSAGSFNVNIIFSNGDGAKVISVSQTDAAGNTGSDSRSFIKDSTSPSIVITSPAAGTTAATGLTIGGTCESGLQVNLSGAGLASPSSVSCTGGSFSANILFSAGDGAKLIRATQTDAVGNSAYSERSFMRDNSNPLVLITGPAANTSAISGLTVVGTCETGLQVNLSGAGLANPVNTTCNSGNFAAAIVFSSGEGSKLVIASQTDGAGNTGSDSRNFIKDSLAPVVQITGPAAGTIAQTGLTIVGTCESGLQVSISGAGVNAPSITNCLAGSFSSAITFSNGDGSKLVSVSQTDAAGNVGSNGRSFVKDTTAPMILITSPAVNTTAQTGLTIGGTCETGLTVNISGSGVSAPSTTSCVGGAFSAAILFSANDGVKPVNVSQTDSVGNVGSDSRNFQRSSLNNGSYTFTSEGPGGKVDILFVDDNSASMEEEQRRVGDRFSSFTANLAALDWQVGITTTDCSAGTYGICGSLLPMAGAGTNILRASTPNYLDVFKNTIQRPETFDPVTGQSCILTGNCPSGNEQALLATMTAMDKRATNNTGFFRTGSDLAVVVLSDEDERSNGPATATTAQEVVDKLKSIWPTGKKFSSYGIIIQPGDAACLATQRAQFGGNGYYGTRAQDLADLTDGITVSICETDYSLTLAQIADDVTRLTRTVELADVPIPSSVTVTFTPSFSTTWAVDGNRITFATSAPYGTVVQISYQY